MYTPPPDLRAKASATAQGGSTHELAHEMLHKAERRTVTTKTVRETEAEAVAFVVGKTIGLQTGRASADYIHLYHGNAALLGAPPLGISNNMRYLPKAPMVRFFTAESGDEIPPI
jgi:hypothetical protein